MCTDLELSYISTTVLRSVRIGKECHIHLSLIQEVHHKTSLPIYGYYRLAVRDKSGYEPCIYVMWTWEEALDAFSDQCSILYYTHLN